MRLLRMMCLLSLGCMMILAEAGFAADSKSSFDWTGPYLGARIGYGWGVADTSFSPLPTASSFFNLAPTKLSPHPKGIVGGAQAGYNYQMERFIFGIEAHFSGSGMSGDKTVSPIIQSDGTPFPGGGLLRATEEINWYGALCPRVGYAVIPTIMLYGTGGLAYGDVSYSANTDFRPTGTASYPASFSKTKIGWTVGGGAEYAISKHWTVKAEYLYMDLGSESVNADPSVALPPFQVGYNWETTANILSLGLNYKF